jgi:hypothetical protein
LQSKYSPSGQLTLVNDKSNFVSLVKLPIFGGKGGRNIFRYNLRVSIFVKRDICIGIEPLNKVSERSTDSILSKQPISVGIVPLIFVLDK